MISAVRQFFQAQIDLAEKAIQREQIDSTFTHEFFIKKKNVEKLVLNALAKVSGSPVEREIKRAFNKHYNRIYSTTNVKSLMDQDAFFGKSNLPDVALLKALKYILSNPTLHLGFLHIHHQRV